MSNLAENVRRLRRKLGMSAAELAEKAGISSVRMIEAGRVDNPRLSTVQALARVLGCSVADLYRDQRRARKAS
jgi:transcriptional regulator with XRE-family HTH domain